MNAPRTVCLQTLLEDEGESLGNLSQHLAMLGIRWYMDVREVSPWHDPAEREINVFAWPCGADDACRGVGTLTCDMSGEWTAEELVLSVLEVALRALWQIYNVYLPGEHPGISPDD